MSKRYYNHEENNERFSFREYNCPVDRYYLMQQIDCNGKPGIIHQISITSLYVEVRGRYGRIEENGWINSLTCEELGVHDWEPFASMHAPNYWEACIRCWAIRETNGKVSDMERTRAITEYQAFAARLEREMIEWEKIDEG